MGNRRKSREMALQALYQCELSGDSAVDSFSVFCRNFEASKKAIPYAEELIKGVALRLSEINELIEKYSANWRLSRMSIIDRNILRLAVYEMCMASEVPPSVVINEALEIARRYSTDDSIPFINGILDAMRKNTGNGRAQSPEAISDAAGE